MGFVGRLQYITSTLRDHEVQARTEKAALAALDAEATKPIPLPTPDELKALVGELEELLAADVLAGREALRVLLKDGVLVLEPQPEGFYIARSEVLPLMLMTRKSHRPLGGSERPVYSRGSGGALCGYNNVTSLAFSSPLGR